jgi:hypothetical protein
MAIAPTPSVNLEAFDRITVVYDRDDDIVVFHLDGPRPAITEAVDDSWYLRVADDVVVGMELHGLRRAFLSTPFYASLFRPAIHELEQAGGRALIEGPLVAEGSTNELPMNSRLVLLLVGQALAKYEALRQREFADAGRALLGS